MRSIKSITQTKPARKSRGILSSVADVQPSRPLIVRSIPIHDLNSEELELVQPIQVEIEIYREETIAKVSELNLWASMNSESEALLQIKKEICELWEDLSNSSDSALGKLPSMWKRILT